MFCETNQLIPENITEFLKFITSTSTVIQFIYLII